MAYIYMYFNVIETLMKTASKSLSCILALTLLGELGIKGSKTALHTRQLHGLLALFLLTQVRSFTINIACIVNGGGH